MQAPIGVFDSGYGGLSILKEIATRLPQYDYIYLGDNARAPYGTRSYETIYHYTLECVQWFFEQGCPLVILACNTASAKALRTIQQNDLPKIAPDKRVLGIVRPTCEVLGNYSQTKNVGILATSGTVQSESYIIEINKFFPDIKVFQEACPMWVPLVENNEMDSAGAKYFVKKNIEALLKKEENIDAVLLACTHYPLLLKQIKEYMPVDINVVTQGKIVAHSLADYLYRHPEMQERISQNYRIAFHTTDDTTNFNKHAALFYGAEVKALHVEI